MFNLKTGKQRHIITVALDPMHHVRHHMAHELLSLFVNVVGIDKNLADVWLEVITNGTNDQRRLLINQEGAVA